MRCNVITINFPHFPLEFQFMNIAQITQVKYPKLAGTPGIFEK